jgi:hypothetical protein
MNPRKLESGGVISPLMIIDSILDSRSLESTSAISTFLDLAATIGQTLIAIL